MQIHELNNFVGTPTSTDYLAIDNSTTTTKIGATGLGVQDKLTVAEANTGTSTASRIVTPKVVHDYVVQDTTHLASGTISSWASITGNDGSINDIISYIKDRFTWKKLTSVTYPVAFGSGGDFATFASNKDEIKNANEVIILSGGQTSTTWAAQYIPNLGITETISGIAASFILDVNTGSNTISSAYGNGNGVQVDFTTGTVQGRQFLKKANASATYCHAIYYR